MNSPGDSPERAAKRTADFTTENGARRGRVTGVVVRDAARIAMRRTISFGRGARSLALGPIEDSVRAATEIGGETGAFVRDAVIGVLEGTGQVVRVTAPAVRDVVAGSIRGSRNAEVSVEDAGRWWREPLWERRPSVWTALRLRSPRRQAHWKP